MGSLLVITERSSFGSNALDSSLLQRMYRLASAPTGAILPGNSSPTITINPSSESVANGGTASFTAAAVGVPNPTIQWQVSTDGGSTWTDVTGATHNTYSFVVNSGENGYKYRAVFTNEDGTATTTSATLTVTLGPTSVLWYESDNAFQDTACTIPAVADGASVRGWKDKDGSNNATNSTVTVTLTANYFNGLPALLPDKTSSMLTLATPLVLTPPYTIYFVLALDGSDHPRADFFAMSNANGDTDDAFMSFVVTDVDQDAWDIVDDANNFSDNNVMDFPRGVTLFRFRVQSDGTVTLDYPCKSSTGQDSLVPGSPATMKQLFRWFNFNLYSQGHIMYMRVFDTDTVDTGDDVGIVNYIFAKYGINLDCGGGS